MEGRAKDAVNAAERVIEDLGAGQPELRRRLEAALLSATLDDPALAHVAAAVAEQAFVADDDGDFGAKALAALIAWRDAGAVAISAVEATARAEWALEGDVLLEQDAGGVLSVVAADVLAMADSELVLRAHNAGLTAARQRGSVLALAINKVVGR